MRKVGRGGPGRRRADAAVGDVTAVPVLPRVHRPPRCPVSLPVPLGTVGAAEGRSPSRARGAPRGPLGALGGGAPVPAVPGPHRAPAAERLSTPFVPLCPFLPYSADAACRPTSSAPPPRLRPASGAPPTLGLPRGAPPRRTASETANADTAGSGTAGAGAGGPPAPDAGRRLTARQVGSVFPLVRTALAAQKGFSSRSRTRGRARLPGRPRRSAGRSRRGARGGRSASPGRGRSPSGAGARRRRGSPRPPR